MRTFGHFLCSWLNFFSMDNPDSSVSEVICYAIWLKILSSLFSHLTNDTSEQEVMTIFVEHVQAVTGLCGIKNNTQIFHKCNLSHARRFMNSHPT
jgi:hypothetical protein